MGPAHPWEAPILCASGGASELCCEYHQGGVLKISKLKRGEPKKNGGGDFHFLSVNLYTKKNTR